MNKTALEKKDGSKMIGAQQVKMKQGTKENIYLINVPGDGRSISDELVAQSRRNSGEEFTTQSRENPWKSRNAFLCG